MLFRFAKMNVNENVRALFITIDFIKRDKLVCSRHRGRIMQNCLISLQFAYL